MAVRGTVDANAGGTLVSSVTGTANQVTASPTTDAVVVGLPTNVQIGTSLALGGATIGTNDIAGPQWSIRTTDGAFFTTGKIQVATAKINLNSVTNGAVTTISTGYFGFSTSSSDSSSGIDLFLSRGGPASFQLGAGDVDTAPVAQTYRTQGALAGGTSDIAGANWTFIASPGKGTGVGGSFIFQTAPAGSTGTVVNAPVTALTIDSTKLATFAGALSSVGALTFTTNTSGVVLKRGANGLCGTFVANGATPVVVSNTNVAITDTIIISLNTIGGTVGVQPHVSAITGATSFAVTCTAVDTSTYNYAIIKNAA